MKATIRELRERLRLRQDEMARELGVGERRLRAYEMGKCAIPDDVRERIEQRFSYVSGENLTDDRAGFFYERREHTCHCMRCQAEIIWYETGLRAQYCAMPGSPADRHEEGRFKLCAPCTASAFYARDLQRWAGSRYDILRAAGVL